MNPVIKALNFRHACKLFDPDKKISKEKIDLLLMAAHLSPTSFGLEAWKLIVISSDAVKQALRPACWNQPQITDASHVMVILAQPGLADPSNEYIRHNFERRGLTKDAITAYVAKYKTHMETEVFPRMSAYAWCAKQCYIVLGNIMTTAASEKIDTCPIEGFEKEWVEKVLDIDTDQYEVAVVVALGYRAKSQPERMRHPFDAFVEYR